MRIFVVVFFNRRRYCSSEINKVSLLHECGGDDCGGVAREQ